MKKILPALFFLQYFTLLSQSPSLDFGEQGIFSYSQDSSLYEVRDLITTLNQSTFCLLAERKFVEGTTLPENNIVLVKIDSIGKLDTSFATNGVFAGDFPGFDDSYPFDLYLDQENLFITGIAINPSDINETVTLKLDSLGAIDIAYGTSGIVIHSITPSIDARAHLLTENEDTYLYGSAYFELRNETNEFPFVKKYENEIVSGDFGTNGGQFYDLIFAANETLPTAKIAHVEGGTVFGGFIEDNRLLFYGFNYFQDGYKSAHIFAVNKSTGLLDDTYGADGVNDIKGEVDYNCELRKVVTYNQENWAGVYNDDGISSDFELYNLETENSYTIDFGNRRDQLNDVCISNIFIIGIGNITENTNVSNPFFTSNFMGIAAFDLNSLSVWQQFEYNPNLGHTEYGAEKVTALNDEEVIIAGWGSKGFKKDLLITKWSLNELVAIKKQKEQDSHLFYPNKVQQGTTINFNKEVNSLQVLSTEGKILFQTQTKTQQLDTSSLPMGFYSIFYEVNGMRYSGKLIVD